MHNACRLWHTGTDYTFTESKQSGGVVGSLETHNGNAPFYKCLHCCYYLWKGNINISQIQMCRQEQQYPDDRTASYLIIKVSIVVLSLYYGGGPGWIPECCYFCWLKCQWIWLNNVSLLYFICLVLRDKQRSSTFTSGRRGEDSRIQVVQYFIRIYMYFVIW